MAGQAAWYGLIVDITSEPRILGGYPVRIVVENDDGRARVDVCLLKARDSAPIWAEELTVKAYDGDRRPLQLVDGPPFPWLVESSTLGSTAVGSFEFAIEGGQRVRVIEVGFHNEQQRFQMP